MSLLDFFITSAFAETTTTTASAAAQPNSFAMPIILVGFILFIYFTVWRPQSKRAQEQKSMMGSLAKGDEIVTTGGIVGKISKINDTYIVVTISENVDITMQKSSVANVLPKGTLKSI